jgi:NAD(P)H-nitrite reductase large subunit
MPRSGFHDQLANFDDDVRAMFTAVVVGVDRATAALLAGDTSEADRLMEGSAIAADVLSRVEAEP